MKKVLILVLSRDAPPYDALMKCSMETWDSIDTPGTQTIFYTSKLDAPGKQSTDKIKYFDVCNDLYCMGRKNLAMFEWALANLEFDYVCRVNASCYVHKKGLLEFVQTLPDENVFVGAEVKENDRVLYYWGGCSFFFSKDVIQKIVKHKDKYQHDKMEDISISYMIFGLRIPIIPAKSCTVDKIGDKWRLMIYGGGESFLFTNFEEVKKANGFLFRVKFDSDRTVDEYIMRELFRVLN